MKQGYREEMTEEYTKSKTEVQNGILGAAAEGKGDNADVGSDTMEGSGKHAPNGQE